MGAAETNEPDRITAKGESQAISAALNPAEGPIARFAIIHALIHEDQGFIQIQS